MTEDRYDGEKVLVFGAKHVEELMRLETEEVNDRINGMKDLEFRLRGDMEEDPGFKQIIPYCIISTEIDGAERYFLYRRGVASGEKRLVGNFSIGVGGHVNPCDDVCGDDAISQAIKREIIEEIGVDHLDTISLLGLIYDDSTEVGKVHFGVAFKCQIDSGLVELCDDGFYRFKSGLAEEIDGGMFLTSDGLKSIVGYESWSEIALGFID